MSTTPTRLFRIVVGNGGPALWAVPAVASAASPGSLFHPLTPADQERFSSDPCCWLAAEAQAGDGNGASPLSVDSSNPVRATKVLPPIAPEYPAALYVIGLNYRKHAAETGNKEPLFPIVVGCSPASVVGTGADIELPRVCDVDEVDYEAELAIVIGRKVCIQNRK
jgi:2-keto-4-pentenoate hydratase/2-oxohepta-3-ene-1,7-dioic acid hydratase in catechol pathway